MQQYWMEKDLKESEIEKSSISTELKIWAITCIIITRTI